MSTEPHTRLLFMTVWLVALGSFVAGLEVYAHVVSEVAARMAGVR